MNMKEKNEKLQNEMKEEIKYMKSNTQMKWKEMIWKEKKLMKRSEIKRKNMKWKEIESNYYKTTWDVW